VNVVRSCDVGYLSKAIAVSVLTEALTAVPCKNGVALHIAAPNRQPTRHTRIGWSKV